ncbi:MAG: mannitol dehydrogenase family protein, partial [Oscillospiraceae bacterium]|nr:mannitol dehydrogenase family protein [Oscillospiraceae bacterium]
MKLTVDGIKERSAWEKAGITLPGYDVKECAEKAKTAPQWVHFGIGNIFRVFIGGIADGLLEENVLDRGIICAEAYDFDIVDKIYTPYDDLGLNVILRADGVREYKVTGSMSESVKAQFANKEQWARLKEIFASESLQMVS